MLWKCSVPGPWISPKAQPAPDRRAGGGSHPHFRDDPAATWKPSRCTSRKPRTKLISSGNSIPPTAAASTFRIPIGLGIHAYFECRDTIKRSLPGLIKLSTLPPHPCPHLSPPPPVAPQPSASTHPLRIALGADHGGIELKQAIHAHLSKKGFVVSDFGAYSHESRGLPGLRRARLPSPSSPTSSISASSFARAASA